MSKLNPYTEACVAFDEQLKKLRKDGNQEKIKAFLADRTRWITDKTSKLKLADKRDAAVRVLTAKRNVVSEHHVG